MQSKFNIENKVSTSNSQNYLKADIIMANLEKLNEGFGSESSFAKKNLSQANSSFEDDLCVVSKEKNPKNDSKLLNCTQLNLLPKFLKR